MSGPVKLDGIKRLVPKSRSILLDRLEVEADIGFHDFEIGTPQRLIVSVELWLEDPAANHEDDPQQAWDYDFLRREVIRIAQTRRWNLQETLVGEIFDRVGALHGVKALRVRSEKPDIYEDAQGVGVELCSFEVVPPTK
ncbi:dihydroneopterin aldolase [Sphingomicrobium clamense]|uniref:dihydroneopterin aldolase n=1 Tax=Sphingomicrobium clamense TaxID=2851013 RepID=A0ABS6V784_9SPHN|nr:dihydroneopterin aldolase [Sphingomicrobium sp. B8]MBW0145438.1 dihydroneopterin aldolase [Sphingomicrobium sp. B8]